MEDSTPWLDTGKAFIDILKIMKKKGLLTEEEILDVLWESKDPLFPWTKQDIKDLIDL